MDLTHPLPLVNLKNRFLPVFSTLNLGLSVRLERLPHSGVSSLIQYIVSDPTLYTTWTSRKLVYLHPENLGISNTSNLLREIIRQITEEIEINQDEYFLLAKLKSQLKSPITLIVDWSPRWLEFPDTVGFCLKSLFESGVSSSRPTINFLYVTPPEFITSGFYSHLPEPHKILYFDLFNPQETKYSILRFLSLYQKTLPPHQISQIVDRSSGLAGLIKPLLEIYLHNATSSDQTLLSHSKIQTILSNLQKYRTYLPKKLYLNHLLNIYSPPEKVGNINFVSPLTHQDMELIRKFLSRQDEILSREDIADVIWGKLATEKYSDWAIDKAISRLRQKINPGGGFKLITIKNSGYKLISI